MDSAITYEQFIQTKKLRAPLVGLDSVSPLAPHLFRFQRESVDFGLRVGSWGCFFDTGLGKTACELEWCSHALEATNGHALILTPLAVSRQIEREAHRWGYTANVVRSQDDVKPGISICNYDRLHLLQPDAFGAIALDEASILKNFNGTQSRALTLAFSQHRFRMVATATPAPNDHTELAQHAAFLGLMTRDEMLVRWFVNDSGDTKSWRLKGHAVEPFFDWMASWSRMAEHPRDLGDDVIGFDLPPFEVIRHRAPGDPESSIEGGLFGDVEVSATTLHDVKRRTAEARAAIVAECVNADPSESWVIWCDSNYEADALMAVLPHASEVRGSHSIEQKEDTLAAFADGRVRQLVSKAGICGYGLNWQFCARMAYVGRSFSYEDWYQGVRRCWRFGQARNLQVHLIVAEGEDAIGRVLDRKAGDHAILRREMVAAMARATNAHAHRRVDYNPTTQGHLPSWLGAHTA